MNITDYLAAEGVYLASPEELEDRLLAKIPAHRQNRFFFLRQALFDPQCVKRAMGAFERFSIRQGMLPEFHSMQYENITHEVPVVLERLPQGAQVLDVGCIDGLLTTYYALARPDIALTGIDRNDLVIPLAQQRSAKHGMSINFRVADFLAMDDGPRYDAVVATRVFHEQFTISHGLEGMMPIYQWDKCMQRSHAMLKPGGVLFHSIHPTVGNAEDVTAMLKDLAEPNGFVQREQHEWIANEGESYLFVLEKR